MSEINKEKINSKSFKYLSPLIETIPEDEELNLKSHQRSLSKNSFYSSLPYTNYNNNSKLLNKNNTIQNSLSHTRYNSTKLPLLINSNEIVPFYKMKQYIVPIPKKKHRKKINKINIKTKTDNKNFNDKEKKDCLNILLSKKENNKTEKQKSLNKSEDNKIMNFNDYLKMQSLAEVRLRPIFGDNSLDLVNYINKVSVVRKNIMDDIIRELNNAENRYNSEKPEVDCKFRTKNKILIDNKWKNAFGLKEYQKFFSKNLKGKISGINYRLMIKKFRQISHMCFCDGNLNLNTLKRIDYVE